MTFFMPDQVRSKGNRPDRLDALVWGLTEVALDGGGDAIIQYYEGALAREGRATLARRGASRSHRDAPEALKMRLARVGPFGG